MVDFDLNISHRQSTRLHVWDYGSNGKYFVTICTENKVPYFGVIGNFCLTSTPIGDYATKCWYSIPDHYPFVELDAFFLMPDHLHGIICIAKKERSEWKQNQFGPQIQNLGAVVRGFKGAVTSYAKTNSIPFQWQSRYFDRVIRSDHELNLIRDYIRDNPEQWQIRNRTTIAL
ncbi:MAG: transposase [Bacteroidia bacterium]|nr:transposase [Bacteroidia bacterium]